MKTTRNKSTSESPTKKHTALNVVNHISLTQKCNIQAHLYLNRFFFGVLSSYFTFQVNVNRHKIEFTIYIHKPQFYTWMKCYANFKYYETENLYVLCRTSTRTLHISRIFLSYPNTLSTFIVKLFLCILTYTEV